MNVVTVEEVLKQALAHDDIKKYLPEEEDLSANLINRDFLFSLVHTLEPTYFKRVIKEHYDAHRQAKMKEKGD